MPARSFLRASRPCLRCCYSTAAAQPAPPLLLKIRGDMKDAMRAKDTNRLNVLRGILSQALNASKTSNPISTDMQMLALLKKSANQSKSASDEFKAAGRQDLADKEDTQVKVLEEYAGSVNVVGGEEIKATVRSMIANMKSTGEKIVMGDVLKKVFAPDTFGGKPVERAEVAKAVKQVMAESS